MFQLITREEALRNLLFASVIHRWQREIHPDRDPYMREAGEYYDDELEDRRFFPQEECDRLYAEQVMEHAEFTDHIVPVELESVATHIFQLPESDITAYPYLLGDALAQLSRNLGTSIHFLLELKVPWLSQDNDYPPVIQALAKLREWGVAEDFTGGLLASDFELAQLTARLFWLIRCNAALPSCWSGFENLPLVAYICRYGNLHVSLYDVAMLAPLKNWADSQQLITVTGCGDFLDNRNESGGVAGRQRIS